MLRHADRARRSRGRAPAAHRVPLAAALAALAVLAGGCGDRGGSGGGRIEVVATTSHAAELAREVGGARVSVHALLPAGADPHAYEPRPSDARALTRARLVVRAGGEIDGWLSELVDAAGDAPVLDLAERLGVTSGQDPHWWLDPLKMRRAAVAVERALAEADPGGRAEYARRGRAYRERLARLDRDVAACLARVPPERRRLVATHRSLDHLADRYGLEVVGAVLPSRSTEAGASAGDLARLVRLIRRERVAAIFPESDLDPRLERAVARDAGAIVGDALWTDALGRPGSGAATYAEAMRANARALARGLTRGRVDCR